MCVCAAAWTCAFVAKMPSFFQDRTLQPGAEARLPGFVNKVSLGRGHTHLSRQPSGVVGTETV